jgi:hypothetical protein
MLSHRRFLCRKFGFQGYEFTKDFGHVDREEWPINERSFYDVHSIMHYSTDHMGWKQCDDGDLSQCILLKYKDHNHHELGVEKITGLKDPSETDKIWVRSNYPWKAEGSSMALGEALEKGGPDDVEFVLFNGKMTIARRG